MKPRLSFRRGFLSSGLLAIVPTLLISVFLPELGDKYSLVIEELPPTTDQLIYTDINGDSISESIQSGEGNPPYHFVVVRNNDLAYYDQWNLPDHFAPRISTLSFGDYDDDGLKEIYVFTMHKDSIFLNVNEFFDAAGLRLERIFITTVQLVKNENTSSLEVCGLFDENEDGNRELYFSITTGFGLTPRHLYCYDMVRQTLKSSPFTGININGAVMRDVDGDRFPELFGFSTASGNYHVPVPYSDYSAWLMVFDHHLQFKFEPIGFPGFGNALYTRPFNSNGTARLLVSLHQFGTDTTRLRPKVMIYSTEGKLLIERDLHTFGHTKQLYETVVLEKPGGDKILLLTDRIHWLSDRLEVIESRPLPFDSPDYTLQADIEGDGPAELLVYSRAQQKLAVYNSDLELYSVSQVDLPDYRLVFSHFVDNRLQPKLFLRSGNRSYLMKLDYNPHHLLSYLVYPGIYLCALLFVAVIRKINTYQVVQRERLNQRLLTLQLQGIKAQFDPHFTFNALNSAAALLYLEDRAAAYDALGQFTRLLRQMLNDSDRIYRTLGEELEFVTGYLKLEKIRFGEKFHYEIKVGADVSLQTIVPKLVLQTHAENAIKHGIMPAEAGGVLRIEVNSAGKQLSITVSDNGVGRARAATMADGRVGRGLKMTREFYKILNQMHGDVIEFTLTDLYDESGMPSGTRVNVLVSSGIAETNFAVTREF